jgi:hypothetical protein
VWRLLQAETEDVSSEIGSELPELLSNGLDEVKEFGVDHGR